MSKITAATSIDSLDDLNGSSKRALKEHGYKVLGDLKNIHFPKVWEFLSFDQAKELLKVLITHKIPVHFSKPGWSEDDWKKFVESMFDSGLVTWGEIAMAVCGEMNPPQVGTAIASSPSFQKHFKERETMKNVMAWFYKQSGKCTNCGTRLFLEADHIRSKQDFKEAGEDPTNADTLDNLQLLCKRCNVIKRPSHALGGISFAPAQSVLVWILLTKRPATRADFYTLCREHGLTMASVRFDEAWALAEWLKRENKYP